MDDPKKADKVTTDDKSSEDTKSVDKASSQKPEFTKEQMETEVLKRVSDKLAEKGDKVKPLEERVKTLEGVNATLRDTNLKVIAEKHGLDVEELKKAGIDNPERVATYVALFGKKKGDELKDDPKPDSGKTTGGGELTEEEKLARRYPTMK